MDYNNITNLLTEKRISVPQLAEKIGMTKGGLYSSLEKKTLTVAALEKIAEVLEVPITTFFNPDIESELKELKEELEEMKYRMQVWDELKTMQFERIALANQKMDFFQYQLFAIFSKMKNVHLGFLKFWWDKIYKKKPEWDSEYLELVTQLRGTGDNLWLMLEDKYRENSEKLKDISELNPDSDNQNLTNNG